MIMLEMLCHVWVNLFCKICKFLEQRFWLDDVLELFMILFLWFVSSYYKNSNSYIQDDGIIEIKLDKYAFKSIFS